MYIVIYTRVYILQYTQFIKSFFCMTFILNWSIRRTKYKERVPIFASTHILSSIPIMMTKIPKP